MTLFQYHFLGLTLTSVTTLGFGLFVLWKNPRNSLHRSMAAYCASLAWWSGWECAALLAPTPELSFIFMRIEYIGVLLISTLFCATVSYLLKFSNVSRKYLLTPLYTGSFVFLFPLVFFPTKQLLWISDGPVSYLPIWGWAGPYYWIFLVFFIGTGLLGHGLVFYRWLQARGSERARLFIFSTGTFIVYLCGCPEFALKYGVRLGLLNPFGLYAFPLYIGLLTYAVVRHNFLDIHVTIRRSLVYSLLITLLTAGYFGLVYAVEWTFRTTLGYQSIWLSLAAFALMALLFQPLKSWIQRAVDWLVFRVPQEELARRMERLEQEARQAEKFRAVSTLAAGMAHEIKNPLCAIETFVEILPERKNDPVFLDQLHKVLSAELPRVRGIVREVLDFAKPKAPQIKPVDLGALIHSTVDLLSNDLRKRRIRWILDCQHNGALFQADADQLRQVLINLIQNAADAMPEGGSLTLSTRADDSQIELTVSDTGTGIPKEILPKLFDPFVTTKEHGNGLGLSTVYSIIKAHRGTIKADSAPGQGTTFTLRLPL